MTPQQAKQILLPFRPWAKDHHDAEAVEALAGGLSDAILKRIYGGESWLDGSG